MTPLALALVLGSAVLHAGWNYLGKTRRPTASFFAVANLTGFVVLSPMLLLHTGVVSMWPTQMWLWLLATGFCQAVYCSALAGAYRSGDMSIVYPLARSSPIIVVMATTVLFGRGHELSMWCAVGAVMIVAGCFLIPMKRFSDLRWSNYLNVRCLLALLAAVGTAGYSIVDDEALRLLRGLGGWDATLIERTLLYACLQALSAGAWLTLFVMPASTGRASMRHFLTSDKWSAMATGIAIYATYSLVLVAMAFAHNISYIVAFRQISIPIGVGLGVVLLNESLDPPKIAGVAVLLAGLMMVALG